MGLKITFAAAAAALGASAMLTGSAMAGFTASTGIDPFTYTGPGTALAPAVGGTITITNQSLADYDADTAADPQIIRTPVDDLPNFLFSLNLTVNANIGGSVLTTGTYSLFYDLGSNGTPDIRVSSGSANLFLTPRAIPGEYTATGTLAQIIGPANPAFRDLAYGDNANFLLDGGVYTGAVNGGTLDLILRQNAQVPEPTTIAAIAGLGVLGLRRRRA